MHLKEIRMENFKTFRKKISIPVFKGFTGITGPNGSGKSNIADAVLFVLGPKSSKMVRAKRLQELIFHGNQRWKAAKQCRVTLVFDNMDRMIPVDSDDVELTRVIKISQTDPDQTLSYFYVNGRTSSQGEFENILTHANLSAEGYNIVLQGHVNEFINKTPLKVREEIDDIAGIRKYDSEISVATDKRQKAEENMENIRWRLDFFKDRLKELKREKEEAEKYRDAQNRIKMAKATLLKVQRDGVEAEIQGYQRAIENAENEKLRLKGEIDRTEAERDGLEREIKETQDRIADITGEEGKKLKGKLDSARLELMRAKDIIETAEETINDLKGEKKLREEERRDTEKKVQKLEKEIEGLRNSMAKLDERIGEEKRKMGDREKALDRSDMELLDLRRDLGSVTKELESMRDLLSKKTLERDREEGRIDLKGSAQSDVSQMVSTLRYEIDDMDRSIKELRKGASKEELEEMQREFQEARGEERSLVKRSKELEQERTALNRAYTQLKLELETDEKIRKGVSMAVDLVLTARDRGEIKGIHGTIGELADVPEEYSTALEVAAGGRISAVVVDDDMVASRCIDLLKRRKGGRVTFLPLNKLTSRRPGAKSLMVKDDPSTVGYAVDLVSYDRQYQTAFQWVFSDTLVVDNLDSLRRLMGGVRLVTLDGEISGAGGDITGGSLRGSPHGKGFGKKSRGQLEEITERLKESTERSEALTSRLNEVRETIDSLEARIRAYTSESSEREEKARLLEGTLAQSKGQLQEKVKEEEKLKKEIDSAAERITGLNGEIGELEKKVCELVEIREQKAEKLEEATPRSIRDALRGLREEIEGLSSRRSEQDEAVNRDTAQLTIHMGRSEELGRRLVEIDRAISRAEKEMIEASKREKVLSKEVTALETVLGSINQKTMGLHQKLNDLNRMSERASAKRESAKKDLQTQDSIMITQRTNIRTAEGRLADILREMISFQEIDIGEGPYEDEKALSSTVKKLESILENAGNVNLRALEEFEEKQKKKADIEEELRALEKEKRELDRMIAEIGQKRTSEFMKAYEGIDGNFRSIYTLISGGGEAYFELENREEPLSGGLVIHARPPGKKMTRLNALSGGEKSLTSMAFIFAVQAWDPSPFYLLDEVDQNLDAVNAEIVARMIADNSRSAQFVMISLRKISLKEADNLYGVTLQNGDSVVLGKVDLKEVEAYEKASKSGVEGGVEVGGGSP